MSIFGCMRSLIELVLLWVRAQDNPRELLEGEIALTLKRLRHYKMLMHNADAILTEKILQRIVDEIDAGLFND